MGNNKPFVAQEARQDDFETFIITKRFIGHKSLPSVLPVCDFWSGHNNDSRAKFMGRFAHAQS